MINPIDFENPNNLPPEFLEEMSNNAGDDNPTNSGKDE